MRQQCASVCCVMILLLAGFPSARASTELPSIFDGRVVGLGGAGTAFVDNSTAAFLNPAALENIDRLSVTLGLSPFIINASAPFEAPDGEKESSAPISPLFFAGVAYRLPILEDRIVTGLAVFPTAGMGGMFEDVQSMYGVDIKMGIWMIEANLPVSIRILDNLSVAVGWRMSYIMQTSKQVREVEDLGPAVGEGELSGFHFTGLSAGILYRPIDCLQLGLSYRSEISAEVDGSIEIRDVTETTFLGNFKTYTTFGVPDSFRLGAALWLLEGKLMIALDLKYLAYSESNRKMPITMKLPAGEQYEEIDTAWKDVFAGHFGIEYYVHPMLPVRVGYALSPSATPDNRASFFTTPPGYLHSVHAGLGLEWEHWNVDLAGYYSFNTNGEVAESTNGSAGTYTMGSYLFALSGSYSF